MDFVKSMDQLAKSIANLVSQGNKIYIFRELSLLIY